MKTFISIVVIVLLLARITGAEAEAISMGIPVVVGTPGNSTSRYESFPFSLYDSGTGLINAFYRSAPWPISYGNGCHASGAGGKCRGMEKYYTSPDGVIWTAYAGTNQCQTALDGTGSAGAGQPYGCLFDLPLDGSGNVQDVRTGAGGITALGTYVNCVFDDDNATDTGVYCSRSTDQGATWSTFTVMGNGCLVTYGPLVVFSSTKIGIICKEGGAANQSVYITYSADDGITWGTPTLVQASRAGGEYGIYEAAFVAVNSTTAIGVMRSQQQPPEDEPWFTYSTDGGNTWSTSVQLQLPFSTYQPPWSSDCTGSVSGTIVSPWIIPVSYPSGDYLLLYTERQNCPGAAYGLTLIQGLLFTPSSVISNVANFGNPTQLLVTTKTTGGVDAGYTSVVDVSHTSSQDTLNVVFYQPQTTATTPVMFSAPLIIASSSSTLTIIGSGAGTGTVTSDDNAINCTITAGVTSGNCTDLVANGTVIALTGTPAAGSVFTGFSPASPVTVNSNMNDTATFGPVVPTLVQSGMQVSSGNIVSR
jgi:hypothetical protein